MRWVPGSTSIDTRSPESHGHRGPCGVSEQCHACFAWSGPATDAGADGRAEGLPHECKRGNGVDQRQLIFENQPLGDVATELNRYNRKLIDIQSASLRDERITGVFQSNDPAAFVTFLSRIPGVTIDVSADQSLLRCARVGTAMIRRFSTAIGVVMCWVCSLRGSRTRQTSTFHPNRSVCLCSSSRSRRGSRSSRSPGSSMAKMRKDCTATTRRKPHSPRCSTAPT